MDRRLRKCKIDTELLVDIALPLREFTREQQRELADILAEMAKAIGISQKELSDEVIAEVGGPPINLNN